MVKAYRLNLCLSVCVSASSCAEEKNVMGENKEKKGSGWRKKGETKDVYFGICGV